MGWLLPGKPQTKLGSQASIMKMRKEKACTELNPNILKYYYKGVCTECIVQLEYDLKYESTGGIKKQ